MISLPGLDRLWHTACLALRIAFVVCAVAMPIVTYEVGHSRGHQAGWDANESLNRRRAVINGLARYEVDDEGRVTFCYHDHVVVDHARVMCRIVINQVTPDSDEARNLIKLAEDLRALTGAGMEHEGDGQPFPKR